jgi:hypothetical protein
MHLSITIIIIIIIIIIIMHHHHHHAYSLRFVDCILNASSIACAAHVWCH